MNELPDSGLICEECWDVTSNLKTVPSITYCPPYSGLVLFLWLKKKWRISESCWITAYLFIFSEKWVSKRREMWEKQGGRKEKGERWGGWTGGKTSLKITRNRLVTFKEYIGNCALMSSVSCSNQSPVEVTANHDWNSLRKGPCLASVN